MTRALAVFLILAGCAEVRDQAGHAAQSRAMFEELRRWTDDETARNVVMCYALMREAVQVEETIRCGVDGYAIPGHWGDGKRRDLEYWLKGAQ